MHWTILWFKNQENLWSERSEREEEDLPAGHRYYAIKQQKMWSAFHRKASGIFGLYLPP